MQILNIVQKSGLVSALALFGLFGPGCVTPPAADDTAATDQASTAEDSAPEADQPAADETPSVVTPQLVTCTTHKGHTAGWIDCTGSGTVRLVIDCTAPQISDYVGPYTTYSGSITLSGQCTFGINSVTYQAK